MSKATEKTCVQVWNECLKIIRDNVNLQSFKTWFEPIKPVKLEGMVLTIQVPSQFFYEWLEEHYVTLLRKIIKRQLGTNARLEYEIIVDSNNGSSPLTTNIPTYDVNTDRMTEVDAPLVLGGTSIKNPFVIPGLKKINVDSQLNPNLNFETFVEGDCNRLSRSAGWAVAQKPGGTSFNPLLLYSQVGLGKTHLAHAVGNQIKTSFPNRIVLYVQSQRFAQQYFEAVNTKTMNDFVNFYQLLDVLIIDDIQFLAGKEKCQETFFSIFNHLHQHNRQLIIASDRAPGDLEGFEDRLLSRFKWGLTAEMTVPDYETRKGILLKKMYADGIELPQDVTEFVAYNINTNVRDLEGALISLLAQSSLNRKQIDLELSKKIIKNFVKSFSREVSIDFILKLVCEFYAIPIDRLKEKTRKRQVVQARQLSMFLAKAYTKNSLKIIGKHFGGRDHSTVIHSCQAVQDLIDTDDKFKDEVLELRKKIQLSMS